ncbi:RNA ligase partner protein [Methanocaldococcus indicus]|uniref:RNA ligase partner protein n=1 Tax=Methanocaldococcus indicus TaxID=213231 RepID=UPI003C6D5E4D
MHKQRFCLDTSVFTEPSVRKALGYKTITELTNRLMDLIAEARVKLNISCHIPYPSVYNELIGFLENENCPKDVIIKVDTWLIKKTPNRYEIQMPSEIFYSYIKDLRDRINKGLRIGEEHIIKTADLVYEELKKNPDINKRELLNKILSKTINTFRNKYRAALRVGTLDSAPDLDVLLLAKELDAAVVASDGGIEKWAQKLGLRFVNAVDFPFMLEEYLKHFKK